MSLTFPNESTEYRAARDLLLEQEVALRRQTEAVAAARRALPAGGNIREDYVFEGIGPDGETAPTRMSELFTDGKDSLVVYSFMYSPDMEQPCPGCAPFLDALDGAAPNVGSQLNFVVVARSPLPRIMAAAEKRGWRHMKLLSSAGNTYNRDYFAESEDGSQQPMMNVFHRTDGHIRHFWGSEMLFAPADPGQDPRHNGTLESVSNMQDLTPEGRPSD